MTPTQAAPGTARSAAARRPRFRWLALVLVGGALLVLAVAKPWAKPEPTHQGRSLSGWLREFERFSHSGLGFLGPTAPAPGIPSYAAVIEALEAIGPEAAPRLAERLAHRPSWYHGFYWSAARRLPYAVTRRLPAPQDADRLRQNAAMVLVQLGSNAVSALPQLVDLLGRRETVLRWTAANVLPAIGPPAASAVPALISALESTDLSARVSCAYALAAIGARPAESGAAIWRVWKDGRLPPLVAIDALARLGYPPEQLLPVYVSVLSSPDGVEVGRGLGFLVKLGLAAAPAWEEVERLLRHPDSRIASQAAAVLAQIGPAAAPAVPALARAFNTEWWYLRENVVKALAAVAPDSSTTIELLHRALQDAHPDVRGAASNALSRAKAPPHPASPQVPPTQP
ncbi:MAG: HEAT repeat domain-containing protein [bacterium]|nr:HEAT repeat domain-containing protein [bacterium]